jgi:alpha-mannosidase
VLPDEFLVSPEALVRNLRAGQSDCAGFGARVDFGYIPDPFGHIGQMPQILRGFGIDTAAFRRGLDDQPCELGWEAPDGSRLLTAYLRDGYDNAARLPTAPGPFAAAIAARRDWLRPHCATSQRLVLNGTDHLEPQTEIPA